MKLAEWMEKKHLLDADVAELLGCDQSLVNRLRRGVLEPSFSRAIQIEMVTRGRVKPRDMVIKKP